MMIFGGNNYHYLKRLRETGLVQEIRDFIESGGVYIGVSAGAMIMGPCIDNNLTFDVIDVGLEDVSGFDFVDFYIMPHWDWREGRWASLTYSWKTGKHIVPLTDQQGILIHDDLFKII
jgi:dipeptidase E